VHVGEALFLHCRNAKEIRRELGKKNIDISLREIGYLGRRFIVYLALVHEQSHHKLRDFMGSQGGYILHLDGTCEGDSPSQSKSAHSGSVSRSRVVAARQHEESAGTDSEILIKISKTSTSHQASTIPCFSARRLSAVVISGNRRPSSVPRNSENTGKRRDGIGRKLSNSRRKSEPWSKRPR